MNYEKEDGYYNVMICNKKTKVNFTIHCVDEYDRERTIKQVELYKCFGRDWYVFTDEEEEKNHQKVKKREKRNESKWKTRRMGGRKNMEILIKEPLKSITKVSVENLELSTLLHLIDCDTIEVINTPVFKEENIILLVDEDGKLKDKKFNFEIYHGGIAKNNFCRKCYFYWNR